MSRFFLLDTRKHLFSCIISIFNRRIKLCFRSMLLLAPLVIVVISITCFTGLVVFAYYHLKGCDPLRAGFISVKIR